MADPVGGLLEAEFIFAFLFLRQSGVVAGGLWRLAHSGTPCAGRGTGRSTGP